MTNQSNSMKTIQGTVKILGLCASVLAAGSVWASPPTFNVNQNYSIGSIIPDNNPSGLGLTESFSAPGMAAITSLTVTLDISGGANGDYYAFLQHGPGFSVLLNRVGRDSGNAFGYGDSGLNVTLDDSAVNGDIHTYQLTLNPGGGALTGTWAPDARTDDPGLVLTTSPRNAPLSSFNGVDPNGNWTLFITDLSPGGVGTLQSFDLNVTGVPEPATVWLLALGGLGLFLGRRFYRRQLS